MLLERLAYPPAPFRHIVPLPLRLLPSPSPAEIPTPLLLAAIVRLERGLPTFLVSCPFDDNDVFEIHDFPASHPALAVVPAPVRLLPSESFSPLYRHILVFLNPSLPVLSVLLRCFSIAFELARFRGNPLPNPPLRQRAENLEAPAPVFSFLAVLIATNYVTGAKVPKTHN